MKKIITGILLTIVSSVFASNDKPVKSTVKNVTVFLQGAQVYRTANINLAPGVTDLLFENVSPYINDRSIQAGGKGSFIILEVKHDIKYPEPPKADANALPKEIVREINLIEDSLQEQSFVADELNTKKFALNLEKDMILKNKLTRGEGKSDSLPMLVDAMEFFRKKLTDIDAQVSKIKREEYKLAQDENRMNERLAQLRAYKNETEPVKKYGPIHRVIVTVSAEESVSGTLDINYIVSNAGWNPSYDLRSGSSNAPVQLTYKANVYQNTGEEWNDIKLKLSTSNPNRSNIKPVLPTWFVNYYYQTNNGAEVQTMSRTISGMPAMAFDGYNEDFEPLRKDDEYKVKNLEPAQSSANYAQMVETMTNVEFDIKLPYSIPSDGTTHLVAVKSSDLPASYYHYLVPKMESEAFLIAKVTGWEEMNLLPGKANIFYEGTYVGETMLNAALLTDTMELALGRDHGITITRTKLPDKERNKPLGNDVEKTVTYELKMKNNKSNTLKLVVEDHIPVSQIEDIKVEMKDKGSAEYNDKTGLLKWNTSINSKENKTLAFTYTITYNKDMPLSMH